MTVSRRLGAALSLGVVIAVSAPAAAGASAHKDVWDAAPRTLGPSADIRPEKFRAFTLDAAELRSGLAAAPKAKAGARPASSTVLTLPRPDGGFERFRVYEAPVMEPALAAKHPDIKTWAGTGIDNPAATVRADITRLGFHASVHSDTGSYYIDPASRTGGGKYLSYFTRDLADDERFREAEIQDAAADLRQAAAVAAEEVQLRTFRLALLTDPTYAAYHGGPANVTAAKVTLINRVTQIYERESAIRLVLIGDTDKLNLNTAADMTGPNGPCGAAPCFTPQQATSCASATLTRNRYVIGQIVGASAYDIGHIALGNPGGGIASAGVGDDGKARGCTGLSTPVGDYFAVDYVSHEMGHQFSAPHTFNGVLSNCSGNRSGASSVEPGSGSSIMAYAGICQRDNLQPHSDPYWVPQSYETIRNWVTSDRGPISEVQTVALRDFDGTDAVTLTFDGAPLGTFTRGTNYSAADIQAALSGNEAQRVALTGYDTDGDAYSLSFGGATSVPIVRGQNNTAAGITAAIQGGNEQQQVTFSGFNQNSQSFTITIGGNTSAVLGQGGAAVTNANVAAAINAIAGFPGGATVTGAGNTGFTVTFGGALAETDVGPISISFSGAATATVRETAKGTAGLASWPAGGLVTVGPVSDSGYTLLLRGAPFTGVDAEPFSIAGATGADGTVVETTKGGPAKLGPGAGAEVLGFFGGAFDDNGFEVRFGGSLANTNVPQLGVSVEGGSGFAGETAKGGPVDNQGNTVTPTGNIAPEVTGPGNFTIPPRTPFALTGSGTDANGDTLTYTWEQVDRAGIQGGSTAGTALLSNTKTNGALFRQFGTAADVTPEDTLKYHSPGLNAATTEPTRVFPDMAQILAGNTNAATGACPEPPPAPAPVPNAIRDCFSEFLPTTDWVGFLSDRTMTFRLTARDSRPGGGGIGFQESRLTIAPLAGPFQVTSHATPQVLYGTLPQTVTWDVAGTDVAPIGVANVRISLISADSGEEHVIAESTPNDGAHEFVWPDVTMGKARIKVEAVGNVFFDVSDADLTSVQAPTLPVGGDVPATLSLSLGAPASFGAFTPGVQRDYDASTSAVVVSTAGDATLSVVDPGATAPGHLVNGAFTLPEALQARAGDGPLTAVSGTPATLKAYDTPVSNDNVTLGFRQRINADDALRTGAYSKTLTFTLSTTSP